MMLLFERAGWGIPQGWWEFAQTSLIGLSLAVAFLAVVAIFEWAVKHRKK